MITKKFNTNQFMKKLFSVVGVLCLAVTLSAQSKLSNLTRNLLMERQLQPQEQSALTKSVVKVDDVDAIGVFVHFYDAIDKELLESYGAVVSSTFEKSAIAIATVPVDKLEALSCEETIKYVEIGTPIYPKLDKARADVRVDDIHNGLSPLTQPYTGKDVVVGAVDAGFQYVHPAFYTPSGELRVKRAWIENGTGVTIAGEKFETAEAIETKGMDDTKDEVGHGTHVLGIAAGSNQDGSNPYYGIAYESDLVMVSYTQGVGTELSVAEGIKYIFDYAGDRPAVANLSLGSHVGPHDGTSTLDVLMDEMVKPGKIIVGSAGNEGTDNLHVSKQFSEEDSVLRTMVKYTYKIPGMGNNIYYQVPIDVWCDKEFKFRVVAYNAGFNYNRKRYLWTSEDYTIGEESLTKRATAYYEHDGEVIISANVDISSEKSPLNDKYHLTLTCHYGTFSDARVYLGLEFVSKEGTIHAWANESFGLFANNGVDGWTNGNTESTMGEIGGTAKRVITVGSYVTFVAPGTEKYSTLGDLSRFSSKGPTVDGRVKPDIVAPGEKLTSAVPNTKTVAKGDAFDMVSEVSMNYEKFPYSRMQGTSMASPMVAGTIATWLQAKPDLTYEEIIDAFKHTARHDEFYGTEVPNNRFGYGKINSYAGLLYILGLDVSTPAIDAPSAMLLYPNPSSGAFNVGFTRNDQDVRISVYGMNGQLIYAENIGDVNAGTDTEVVLNSVQNGAYIVKVQGNAANETFRLLVCK